MSCHEWKEENNKEGMCNEFFFLKPNEFTSEIEGIIKLDQDFDSFMHAFIHLDDFGTFALQTWPKYFLGKVQINNTMNTMGINYKAQILIGTKDMRFVQVIKAWWA